MNRKKQLMWFTFMICLLIFLSSSCQKKPEVHTGKIVIETESPPYAIQFINPTTLDEMDPNNIEGFAVVYINDPNLRYASVWVDNQQVGVIEPGDRIVSFESAEYSNDWHQFRVVSYDDESQPTCVALINVYFNNLIHSEIADDYFHPDEDYRYTGFYDGNDILEAKLIDQITEETIWSNTYSGNIINIVIPGATFTNHELCQLVITEVPAGGGGSGAGSGSGSSKTTTEDLIKNFKKEE